MADFDWSAPEPARGEAPSDEPDVFQTVLPNGLHIRYSSEEELEAAARRLGPEAARRAALLNALRKRHEA
ncbi:MAG: hypothetical protein ACREPI_00195 [Candidatus Dormibacterales bacterium]